MTRPGNGDLSLVPATFLVAVAHNRLAVKAHTSERS